MANALAKLESTAIFFFSYQAQANMYLTTALYINSLLTYEHT